MSEAFDPIGYAQASCKDAGLTADQVSGVQAYLVGLFSSYVDQPDSPRITAARWRRFVAQAIGDVVSDHP